MASLTLGGKMDGSSWNSQQGKLNTALIFLKFINLLSYCTKFNIAKFLLINKQFCYLARKNQ